MKRMPGRNQYLDHDLITLRPRRLYCGYFEGFPGYVIPQASPSHVSPVWYATRVGNLGSIGITVEKARGLTLLQTEEDYQDASRMLIEKAQEIDKFRESEKERRGNLRRDKRRGIEKNFERSMKQRGKK